METESHHAPEGEFPHLPPMLESGFDYHQSMMAVCGPYASVLDPMFPHTQFPFYENGMPPAPVPTSVSLSAPTPVRKSSTGGSTPRRTLTDEDRRNMCLYHEENRTAKQTDIGALFGVERSTVSKVLRQKEKYLNLDDGNQSPIKRTKGRVPNIEEATVNWVKNYQCSGQPLTDKMIRERALLFASTCGCPKYIEEMQKSGWLEIFMQKNGLLGAEVPNSSIGSRSDSKSPTRSNTECDPLASHSPRSPYNGVSSHLFLGQSHIIEGANPPTGIKRNRSNPEITTSMQPPLSVSKSTTSSPISAGDAPNSPTRDEAHSALKLVMTYFKHNSAGLGAREFVSIGKLIQRLGVTKSHQSTLLGDLTRSDEHSDVLYVGKKRCIHNLG